MLVWCQKSTLSTAKCDPTNEPLRRGVAPPPPLAMAACRPRLPVPAALAPSRKHTHFCTELVLTPDVCVEEFCSTFEAMVRDGCGRIENGTIIVHTEQLGLRHVSMTNLERVKAMYLAVHATLKQTVHSSIIVANPLLRPAIRLVMRAVEEAATEVTVVDTTEAAIAKAKEIADAVHIPALRQLQQRQQLQTLQALPHASSGEAAIDVVPNAQHRIAAAIALCAVGVWIASSVGDVGDD